MEEDVITMQDVFRFVRSGVDPQAESSAGSRRRAFGTSPRPIGRARTRNA